MTITRADKKQEEFFTSNGKLYVNFEQEEKTDEEGNTFWEMKTLEVSDKRTAYNEIIAYYEKEQLRPLRELAIDSNNEFAKNKVKFIDEQIAKYR
jgi:hypothetical protein